MMELDSEARRILELAREARTPSAQDKARVERRFALALGLSSSAVASIAAAQPAATAAAKAAGSAVALKWTIGGCALVAAALAGYAALPAAPAQPVRKAAVAARVPVGAPTTPAAVEVAPREAAPPQPQTAPAARPLAGRSVHRRTPAAGADALAGELELLHAAQAAWRAGDPGRALSLLSEHRRRHPRSALALERDALRVLSLCELGEQAEARRLGRAWLAAAPRSPLRASIEQSCAMK